MKRECGGLAALRISGAPGSSCIAGGAGVSTLKACCRSAGGKRRRTRRHRLPIGTSVVPRQECRQREHRPRPLPGGGPPAVPGRASFSCIGYGPKKNGLRDVSRRPSCLVDENYTLLRRSRSLLRYRRRRLTGTTAAPEGVLHRLHVSDE